MTVQGCDDHQARGVHAAVSLAKMALILPWFAQPGAHQVARAAARENASYRHSFRMDGPETLVVSRRGEIGGEISR
jgi:hypothetical protein